MYTTSPRDPYKPSVAGLPDHGLLVIVSKNPTTEETQAVRFDMKYTRQLALDLLDMADQIER